MNLHTGTLILLILFSVGCKNQDNQFTQIEKLDKWTDSINHIYFESIVKFDSIQKSEGSRFREYSYSSNVEQYLLVDANDTLVKVITIAQPDIKITKEYCVPGKNEKQFERIMLNGQVHGRQVELNCKEDIRQVEYYSHGKKIETN